MYKNITRMFSSLSKKDTVLYNILNKEYQRQKNGIELIASENFTSKGVLECLGSILTNKYSEGLPGKRYYGGNQFIDKVEILCQERAINAFKLDSSEWGVNVQPYSGSVANIAVYLGILNIHDRIMGLDLPSGGHLSHGFYTQKKKISNTSVMFESLPYGVNESGYVDYDKLEEMAAIFKPKLLICGGSAYPRDWDYQRFRSIADSIGAYLMCDMAHISGLVATEEMKSPFPFCDIVTSTTHKTLRGPRSGLIFYRKKYENQINESVFPGTQGGPHQNQIGALAHQLLEVAQPEFKEYIKQVKINAKVLSDHLKDIGYKIASDGTDCHIVLANVKDKGVTGSKVEKLCEVVDISINKNTIYGDKSPMNPGGIRLGTAAMTTRGFKEAEFKKVAELINDVVNLAIEIQKKSGPKLVDFNKALEDEPRIQIIKNEVNNLASNYYFPID